MSQFKVALQLYSVREEMEKDMDGTLQKLKAMGYDYVEFAGYFGKPAEEVKGLLDKHGLECVSVHQSYDVFLNAPQESVEYIKAIGARYSAIPWMGTEQHKGSAEFDKTIADFKQVGSLLKEAGITLLYHNHDFEFEQFEGKFLLDWLYESVSEDLLQTEIDTCWVRYAGQDPAAYIRQYSGRSPVVHLKDFTAKNFAGGPVYALIDSTGKEEEAAKSTDNEFMFKPLGLGVQDFPAILQACEDAGTEIVVVEQDKAFEYPPLENARISREYLKTLGL